MSTMAKTTQPRRRRLEFDDEFKMAAVRLVAPKGFEVEVFKRNIFNKEKGVDMKMGIDIAQLVHTSYSSGILIIVAGDADFVPVMEMAREKNWQTEVWYWSVAAKALRNAADRFEKLDPHLNSIGFEKGLGLAN